MFILLAVLLTTLLIISIKSEKITWQELHKDHLARIVIDQLVRDGRIQNKITHVELDTLEKLDQRIRKR